MGAFSAAAREIHENGVIFANGAIFLRDEEGGETDLCGFVQINAFKLLEKFSCFSSLFIRRNIEKSCTFAHGVEETARQAVWRLAVAEDR